MNPAASIHYLDTPKQLEVFCDRLAGHPWLAMDTEFLRERTYYPQFCLLQVAAPDIVACVDPLRLSNLDPLLDILYDTRILKVVHAGRQDLEIFWRLRGALPSPLFDTQLAAPLIGLAEQISYAGLVSHVLNIELDKAQARTDWTARPLSPEQLRYAADDVIFLGQAYTKLRDQLEKKQRLEWLEPEFAALVDPSLYRIDPTQAWRKINGANKLRGAALSILRALGEWRERTAQTENLPRNWLIKDEVLLDLARLAPKQPEDLARIRSLQDRTLRRYGNELCSLIQESRAHPPPTLEEYAKTVRDPEQEALLDLLSAVVRLRAAEHDLNAGVLATRRDLEHLIAGDPNARLLAGWRNQLVGHELARLLEGKASVSIESGRVRLDSTSP